MFRSSRPAPALVALVVGVLAVAGCGGEAPPVVAPDVIPSATSQPTQPIIPNPSTDLMPRVSCTKVFSQQAAEDLAGQRLGRPTNEPVSSLPGCRWDAARSGTWVLALSVPASQWAKAVPAAVETALGSGLEFSGRAELEEARQLIEAGGSLDNAAACRIFSTIATALQGRPPGSTRVINYVPDRATAQGINQQACLKGRYYSVQLVSAQLKPGPALEKRIRQALASFSR